MCYSRISHSRDGLKCLQYILEGEGHDGGKRNLAVFPVGIADGCVKSYYEQFEDLWKMASARNLTRARNIIISFSKKELDSSRPESVIIAQQIAMEICERAYTGHGFVCAIQADNKNKILHMHLVSPNVSTINHKGFTDEQTRYWYLRQITDEVCSKYFELDEGEKSYERKAHTLRGLQEANEEIKKENDGLPVDKQKPLKYIWRDDIKERITGAMQGVHSYEQFYSNLRQNGVDVEPIESKKCGRHFRYILTDTSRFEGKIPERLHARSYRLGDEYGIEALEAEIARNSRKDNKAADNPEPESSPPARPKLQESVMTAAEHRDIDGSVLGQPESRHRSNKTRGKIRASENMEQEPIVQEAKKRKLPRRNHQADINRMIDILTADAEEIKEKTYGDIDLEADMMTKRNPRKP